MKYSLYSLIPFLPSFCSSQFQRLNSIQFLCSEAHILPGWHLETQLTLLNWTLLYNHFAWTTQKTQPLCCWEGMFIAPLHSNKSYSNVACVFLAAGMCLLSSCLAMDISSDFTILAFRHHVTIIKLVITSYASATHNISKIWQQIPEYTIIYHTWQEIWKLTL
jgi:hypothetical protein